MPGNYRVEVHLITVEDDEFCHLFNGRVSFFVAYLHSVAGLIPLFTLMLSCKLGLRLIYPGESHPVSARLGRPARAYRRLFAFSIHRVLSNSTFCVMLVSLVSSILNRQAVFVSILRTVSNSHIRHLGLLSRAAVNSTYTVIRQGSHDDGTPKWGHTTCFLRDSLLLRRPRNKPILQPTYFSRPLYEPINHKAVMLQNLI